MIRQIHNSPRTYAWGSKTLIPNLLGEESSTQPVAEIWFGTHDGSPSVLTQNKEILLSEELSGHKLSFLLKLLAADEPLSIQAHPNAQQAKEGFARENQLGIALDAPERNYKDDQPKPEMIVALSDEFHALCGFRDTRESLQLLELLSGAQLGNVEFKARINSWSEALRSVGLAECYRKIMASTGQLQDLSQEFVAVANDLLQRKNDFPESLRTALTLNEKYPSDVGVFVSLIMNHVVLTKGQALFLPAGNIHAYMSGLAVEIMAASDNVLRGGLTPKHIDLVELERVLDFRPVDVPYVHPVALNNWVSDYPVPEADFALLKLEISPEESSQTLKIPGEAIVLCVSGEITIISGDDSVVLAPGQAAYINEPTRSVTLVGQGSVFLASDQDCQAQ
jgi:mannose-6-phosphate isomerase